MSLSSSTCEKDEVAVEVTNDEGAGAPGLCFECLMKRDACGLKLAEERVCFVDGDGCGEQVFPGAKVGIDCGFVQMPEIQAGSIAKYLGVEGRFAMDEGNSKAKLFRTEVTGSCDVGDKKLRSAARSVGLERLSAGALFIVWCLARPAEE